MMELGLLGVTKKSSAVGRGTKLCPALMETFMSLHGDLHPIGYPWTCFINESPLVSREG